jgi:hypothetical protein
VVLDGVIIQPAARCAWGDLLSVAMRGGKLEVESNPPAAIAGQLTARRQIDVEVTDAADAYWRLQSVPQPGGVLGAAAAGGGVVVIPGGVRIRIGQAREVAPAPAPAPRPAGGVGGVVGGAAKGNVRGGVGAAWQVAFDFTATALGRTRATAEPRLSRVMLMGRGFYLRGRSTSDEKMYQIDFRSYADKTNVSLSVREMSRGRRGAVMSMEAADLQHIRHERPVEVRTYLEPLLREICDGRNPLRPGAGDVYRAFESIPADSAALERVKRIVESFDALEPATRDAASAQLNQLGRAEVLAAVRIDRTELSAEQSSRLDAFVARNSTLADIAAARRDPLFLIDCLEDDDRAVRTAALLQLRQAGGGHEVEFDIDAPAEQRAAAAAGLIAQFFTQAERTPK